MIDDQSLAGMRLLERYWLDDVLATGGLSVVYRGRDAALNRPVAVKVVPRHHATTYRDALRATGALTHPALVVVLDAFEVEDRLFVVQEYVDGQSFARQMHTGLDVGRALQVALQITHCVGYAHEHHVTHGDLTPSAVLLDRDEAVHVNNFRLPADRAYLERTQRVAARLSRILTLPESQEAQPEQPSLDQQVARDLQAIGMLLWQALTTPVASGERQDFRADVSMDVQHLVARLLVREHPDALTSAEAAAAAMETQAHAVESMRDDDEAPTPALLHALHLRQASHHAPWADAETLMDQPAWGPSVTPPPFYAPYQGQQGQQGQYVAPPPTGYPPYLPPAASEHDYEPEYETIPSRRPLPSGPLPPVARAPIPSGPLRAPTLSGPLRAPTPAGPPRVSARPSQPSGYRPQAPLPWNDDPRVARWLAEGQSRPPGRPGPTGGRAATRRRGVRVAPLVLIGIVLFILAFVIGFFGPPFFVLH